MAAENATENEPWPPSHESVTPTTAELVLRQALGSNSSDVRFPSLFLGVTALIVAVLMFRQKRRRLLEMAPGEDPPAGSDHEAARSSSSLEEQRRR